MEIANHLWQSTVFAVAAGVVTLAFRNQEAQVRFWLWFSASAKFLLPFAILMTVGRWMPVPAPKVLAAPAVSATVEQIAAPFPDVAVRPAAPDPAVNWLPAALVFVWACGMAAILAIRVRGWRAIRTAVRASRPIGMRGTVEMRTAPGLMEPGVVGCRRPVLLLPEGIGERLTAPQLEAVVAHELCHVRRRDNLLSATHMLVEALFWFHPLVWWIGARLIAEREQACDEAVVGLGVEPGVYAEGILNVCKLYAGSPLRCVAGVTGSDLKRRVRAILTGRMAGDLSRARKLALATAAAAALAIPVGIGMLQAPSLRAQSAAGNRVKFEVASVKPCNPADPVAATQVGPAGAVMRKGGGPDSSPGRLSIGCTALADLIRQAYISYASGRLVRDPASPPLTGGPDWIRSAHYLVDAKTGSDTSNGIMKGPAMQVLLEDRFHLQVHREQREVPVYVLTVAKTGPKLKPFEAGTCNPRNLFEPRNPPSKQDCNAMFRSMKGITEFVGQAVSLDAFCRLITLGLDRPAIDRTGVAGLYDIQLKFAPDENTPGFDRGPGAEAADPAGPSIFAAVQQLGLKLEPGKGPREYVVIDHVERPTEN